MNAQRPLNHAAGVLLAITLTLPFASSADTTLAQSVLETPKESPTSSKKWLVHLDWFCPSANGASVKSFGTAMEARMNELGTAGWELVAVSPVTIAGNNCLLASYKARTKKN